jgi:hypothetical protein
MRDGALFGTGSAAFTLRRGEHASVTIAMRFSAAAIYTFTLDDGELAGAVDMETHTVTVTAPYGTVRNGLVPAITISEGAVISPASGVGQNFNNPVIYTVTAADGSVEIWTVTVTLAVPSTETDITGFSFYYPLDVEGSVNVTAGTVTALVPSLTPAEMADMAPTITYSDGADIYPSWVDHQDFSAPFTYTVTAEDGVTFKTWTVTVKNALTDAADIPAYLAGFPNTANTADTAVPLALDVTLNPVSWAAILSAIQTAGKYVNLDLTDCTGMTMFDPGTANTGESKIVSLVFPTAATSITAGTYTNPTFRFFTSLKSVAGAGMTAISDYAFYGHTTLTSIDLPAVVTIGNFAFSGCTGLTSIDLQAVTSIGNLAFQSCTALTSIDLQAVTSIGSDAFRRCTALASVNRLSATLTSITGNPFSGCTSLTTIIVDGSNPAFCHSADNKMLLNKTGTALIAYPSASGALTTLPGTITTIEDYAFYESIITSVDLSSVETIGDITFYGCTNLTTVNLPSVETIGNQAFYGCTSLTTVNLPSATGFSDNVFQGTGPVSLTVTLGAAVPTLGELLFTGIVSPGKNVTVKVPTSATAWSGIIGGSPYSGTNTTDNWGNGFRGGGWNGSVMIASSSNINSLITLTVEYE